MNPRQQAAYAQPLTDMGDDKEPLTAVRKHATGLLLMSVLAVDR